MGWWKRRKKRLKAKKYAEFLGAMGWEIPTIKWPVLDILHFQLSAHDESGKTVDEWYLGTRGHNEPDAMFMLVAYGLVEKPERTVTREEAVQLWSKWLEIPGGIIPWLPSERTAWLYEAWIDWAKNDVENWDVAEKQIGELSSSCTFRVSAG